jgi:hypothetical protein
MRPGASRCGCQRVRAGRVGANGCRWKWGRPIFRGEAVAAERWQRLQRYCRRGASRRPKSADRAGIACGEYAPTADPLQIPPASRKWACPIFAGWRSTLLTGLRLRELHRGSAPVGRERRRMRPDDTVRAYMVGKLMRQDKPDDVFTFVRPGAIRALWPNRPRKFCPGRGGGTAGRRPAR